MTAIVRHPNRRVRYGSAALKALLRWYPGDTTLSIAMLRIRWPGYPLITGGSPKPISPAPGSRAGRSCA